MFNVLMVHFCYRYCYRDLIRYCIIPLLSVNAHITHMHISTWISLQVICAHCAVATSNDCLLCQTAKNYYLAGCACRVLTCFGQIGVQLRKQKVKPGIDKLSKRQKVSIHTFDEKFSYATKRDTSNTALIYDGHIVSSRSRLRPGYCAYTLSARIEYPANQTAAKTRYNNQACFGLSRLP